jgi:hypothetical protein
MPLERAGGGKAEVGQESTSEWLDCTLPLHLKCLLLSLDAKEELSIPGVLLQKDLFPLISKS